jgi:hypothetical protein
VNLLSDASLARQPDLGNRRWPSRLVATAEEDRLSIKRNPQQFAVASDCRAIAIYE